MKIEDFNPSGVGLKNNNFIGLPFTEENAAIILFPVPWDVTVSYGGGTSTGPQNILEESVQLDLFDSDIPNAWKSGIYFYPINNDWLSKSKVLRPKAKDYIDFIENGGSVSLSESMKSIQDEINIASSQLNDWVYNETVRILNSGRLIGLIGGDHSTPLGYYKALSEFHPEFGILHIDAHLDLRKGYEGFQYSHASIFNNALHIPNITKLVQVGIRDNCEEEVNMISQHDHKIKVFYDHEIRNALFTGSSFDYYVKNFIEELPEKVYISFDIDGLDPKLCPGTGTPVPGGLSYHEAIHLIKSVVASGRIIIGFDVVETAGVGNQWDGNVAARIVYKLASWMAKSNNIV